MSSTVFQRNAAGPVATRFDEAREGAMWAAIALGAVAAVLLVVAIAADGGALWLGLSLGIAAFGGGAAAASIVLSAMRDAARLEDR
jgi:hypothetical protein